MSQRDQALDRAPDGALEAAVETPRAGLVLGRRAAVEGVGALGVVATVLAAAPRAAALETRPAASSHGGSSLGGAARTLRAHALTPLEGPAALALRACESAGARLVAAYAPRHGGLPFVVELTGEHTTPGTRRGFELLRRDPAGDAPMAELGDLALVLVNRGDGRTQSHQDDARLALRLAQALAPHADTFAALPLTTARERRRRAPFATLHLPLDADR